MRVVLAIAATILVVVPSTSAAVATPTAIKQVRLATHHCQDALEVDRSPVSSVAPVGRAYRHWVLKLWQVRREAFCGALQQVRRLTAHTSVSELARAKEWASSDAARCVSSHEGGVTTNTGNGYYGRWQADIGFQLAYGIEFYRRWGVASNWPGWAQDVMAYRGYQARGWNPWPTTSVMCGVR